MMWSQKKIQSLPAPQNHSLTSVSSTVHWASCCSWAWLKKQLENPPSRNPMDFNVYQRTPEICQSIAGWPLGLKMSHWATKQCQSMVKNEKIHQPRRGKPRIWVKWKLINKSRDFWLTNKRLTQAKQGLEPEIIRAIYGFWSKFEVPGQT